jgi:hypothetical protein
MALGSSNKYRFTTTYNPNVFARIVYLLLYLSTEHLKSNICLFAATGAGLCRANMSHEAPPTFEELEDCVKDVIRYLHRLNVPDVGKTKVLIFGGLALWKYLRNYRATKASL